MNTADERMAQGLSLFEAASASPELIRGMRIAEANIDCSRQQANQISPVFDVHLLRSRENGFEGNVIVVIGQKTQKFAADFLQSEDGSELIFALKDSSDFAGVSTANLSAADVQRIADLLQTLKEDCPPSDKKPQVFVLPPPIAAHRGQ